jgi:hypothetical protein
MNALIAAFFFPDIGPALDAVFGVLPADVDAPRAAAPDTLAPAPPNPPSPDAHPDGGGGGP